MTVLDDMALESAVGRIGVRRGRSPDEGSGGAVPVVYLHSAQGEGAVVGLSRGAGRDL